MCIRDSYMRRGDGRSHYEIKDKIGAGQNPVYSAINTNSGERVAIKAISYGVRSDIETTARELVQIFKEIEISARFNHDAHIVGAKDFYFYESDRGDREVHVVMDLMVGDLDSELGRRRRTSEFFSKEELDNLLDETLSALEALAHNTIAHQDLKPLNVLIDPHKQYRLR
eukprot:TRINITY_DN1873_c0_g4_i1.p2 TRINITY_DN1873_c0_g4~~TRINITY_DN1873_c0_g4_i1.p2  ORF type:complete len:170 (-),score=28.35 TRINITY_DN1873_c0_g4_i1:656-1165(-)